MVKTYGKLTLVLAALLFLGGCSSREKTDVRLLDQEPVDRTQASSIVLDQETKEENGFLKEVFTMDHGDGDEGEGRYSVVSESTGNGKDFFYIKSYSESMSEFSYLNQIYRYDSEQKQNELLYETETAIWLNELAAAKNTLYWVEYLPKKQGIAYQVMQFDLSDGKAECIAERYDTAELCLSASAEYVTWYEQRTDDSSVSIVIYDVKNRKFVPFEPQGSIRLASPYGRLDIVDDGITYFSEDAEGKLYVNRYQLTSQKQDTLLMGDREDFDDLSGCFSDSEYIGWFESDAWGPYYMYHIESGKLYCLEPPEGMEIFTARISSGCLYLVDTVGNRVFACDPETGENRCQKIPEGYSGLRFRQLADGGLYLNASKKGADSLFSCTRDQE